MEEFLGGDETYAEFTAVAGTTYYIAVSYVGDSLSATYSFTLTQI